MTSLCDAEKMPGRRGRSDGGRQRWRCLRALQGDEPGPRHSEVDDGSKRHLQIFAIRGPGQAIGLTDAHALGDRTEPDGQRRPEPRLDGNAPPGRLQGEGDVPTLLALESIQRASMPTVNAAAAIEVKRLTLIQLADVDTSTWEEGERVTCRVSCPGAPTPSARTPKSRADGAASASRGYGATGCLGSGVTASRIRGGIDRSLERNGTRLRELDEGGPGPVGTLHGVSRL